MYGAEKMLQQQKRAAERARRGKDELWTGAEGEEPEAFTDITPCSKCDAEAPANTMYFSEQGIVCEACHQE